MLYIMEDHSEYGNVSEDVNERRVSRRDFLKLSAVSVPFVYAAMIDALNDASGGNLGESAVASAEQAKRWLLAEAYGKVLEPDTEAYRMVFDNSQYLHQFERDAWEHPKISLAIDTGMLLYFNFDIRKRYVDLFSEMDKYGIDPEIALPVFAYWCTHKIADHYRMFREKLVNFSQTGIDAVVELLDSKVGNMLGDEDAARKVYYGVNPDKTDGQYSQTVVFQNYVRMRGGMGTRTAGFFDKESVLNAAAVVHAVRGGFIDGTRFGTMFYRNCEELLAAEDVRKRLPPGEGGDKDYVILSQRVERRVTRDAHKDDFGLQLALVNLKYYQDLSTEAYGKEVSGLTVNEKRYLAQVIMSTIDHAEHFGDYAEQPIDPRIDLWSDVRETIPALVRYGVKNDHLKELLAKDKYDREMMEVLKQTKHFYGYYPEYFREVYA